MTPNRVFTADMVRALQCQNNAIRALRHLDCTVVAVPQREHPTVIIAPPGRQSKLPTPFGLYTHRTPKGDVVSTDVNGCRVEWTEVRS